MNFKETETKMKEQYIDNFEAILKRRLADSQMAAPRGLEAVWQLYNNLLFEQKKLWEELKCIAPWVIKHPALIELIKHTESQNLCADQPSPYGMSLIEINDNFSRVIISYIFSGVSTQLKSILKIIANETLVAKYSDHDRFELLCKLHGAQPRAEGLDESIFLKKPNYNEPQHFSNQVLKKIIQIASACPYLSLKSFSHCLNDHHLEILETTELTAQKLAFIDVMVSGLSAEKRRLQYYETYVANYLYFLQCDEDFFDVFSKISLHISKDYLRYYFEIVVDELDEDDSLEYLIELSDTESPPFESYPEKITLLELTIYIELFFDNSSMDTTIPLDSEITLLLQISEKFIRELRSSQILKEGDHWINHRWTVEKKEALLEIQHDGKSLLSHTLQWINKNAKDAKNIATFFGEHITLAQTQSLKLLKQLLINQPDMGNIITSCFNYRFYIE